MSDFLYSDETDKSHDLAAIGFHSDTDGFVYCAYKSAVDSKLAKADLTRCDTLRKYLQEYLHHSLNAAPDTITIVHLDKAFGQKIVNLSNYKVPEQEVSSIDIANVLLDSLTQDWLDLPMEHTPLPSQSSCTGVRFVFMPRTSQNHVFYDLIQNTQML